MTTHEHVWSKWFPYDRMHTYRYCLRGCGAIEKQKATA